MGDMVNNAVQQIFGTIQRIIASVLCFICDLFEFNELTPDLDRFASMFRRADGSLASIEKIMEVTADIGMLIAVILFVVTCITYWLGSVIEIKDTIIGALGRLFVAWLVCLIFGQMLAQSEPFAVQVSANIENALYTALGVDADANNKANWNKIIWVAPEGSYEPYTQKADGSYVLNDGLLEDVNVTNTVTALKAQAETTSAIYILTLLGQLLHIIIYIIIGYFFMKLVVELVRRYVVYGALTIFSPMMPGFLATSDSSRVFTTFLKMYGTQIGMIIGTRVWIALTLCMMTGLKKGILEVLMIIAFINIGVRLEQYAKDLGLTVTGQGMALLDSVMMTGAIAVRAIGGIGKAGGGMLITGGSFAGQTGMVKMGAVLAGRPADSASVLKMMQGNIGGVAREAFGGGKIASITNSEKAEISKLAGAGFGNNRNVNDFLANLTPEARKEALQHLLDNNYGNINGYLQSEKDGLFLEAAGNEFINGKGMPVQLMDSEGNVWRDGFINSVAQGDQSIAFTGSNGEQLFFNPVGECLNPDAAGDLATGITLGSGALYEENPETGEMMEVRAAEQLGNEPTSQELKYGLNFDRNMILGEDNDASHYMVQADGQEMFAMHNQYGAFAEHDAGYNQIYDEAYNVALSSGMNTAGAEEYASSMAQDAVSVQDIVGYSNSNGLELSLPNENAYSNTYDGAYDESYNNAISSGMGAEEAHMLATENAGNALKEYLNEPNGYFRGTGYEVTSAKQLENSSIALSNGQKMASYELNLRDKATGREEVRHIHPSLYHRELATRTNTNDGMSMVKPRGPENRRGNVNHTSAGTPTGGSRQQLSGGGGSRTVGNPQSGNGYVNNASHIPTGTPTGGSKQQLNSGSGGSHTAGNPQSGNGYVNSANHTSEGTPTGGSKQQLNSGSGGSHTYVQKDSGTSKNIYNNTITQTVAKETRHSNKNVAQVNNARQVHVTQAETSNKLFGFGKNKQKNKKDAERNKRG